MNIATRSLTALLCIAGTVCFTNSGAFIDTAHAETQEVTLRYTNLTDSTTQTETVTLDAGEEPGQAAATIAHVPDWEHGKIEIVNETHSAGFIGIISTDLDGIMTSVQNEDYFVDYLEFSHKFGRAVTMSYFGYDPNVHSSIMNSSLVVLDLVQTSYTALEIEPSMSAGQFGPGAANLTVDAPSYGVFYGTPTVTINVEPSGTYNVSEITSITSPDGAQISTTTAGQEYVVTLPSNSTPDIRLNVSVLRTDASTVTKTLTIARRGFTAKSITTESDVTYMGFIDNENPANSKGVIEWGSEAGNHRAFRTYIEFTHPTEYSITSPHAIVQYFNEANGAKTLLGVKQFDLETINAERDVDVSIDSEVYREIMIYGTANSSLGIEGANAVSIFLISGTITSDTSTFSGVKYGSGNGWYEQMANHPEHDFYDYWNTGPRA